jgi:hypothetical protein
MPDFSWCNIPKRGQIYQISNKYTEFAIQFTIYNNMHSKAKYQNCDFWLQYTIYVCP